MELENIEKFDKRKNNGGFRKNSGRKGFLKKSREAAEKLAIGIVTDITKTAYWLKLAEECQPRLRDIMLHAKDEQSLRAIREIHDRALGRPKESVEHSGSLIIESMNYGKNKNPV